MAAEAYTEADARSDIADVFGLVHIDPLRAVLERTWFRNILYYLGEQWLAWFENMGTFGRRYEIDASIPTPVSNIIRDYVRAMKALTLNKNYVTRVWPNSQDQEDKDASELGEKVLRYMDTLNDDEISDIKELIEIWRIVTGNGFGRTFTDSDTGVFVIDKSGTVISKDEVVVECILPFNVVLEPLGVLLREKRLVGIKSLKYKEWVEDSFNVIVETTNKDTQLIDYQKQLMTLVTNVSPWKGRGFETSMLDMPSDKLCIFKEIEFRPTKRFPKGRYVASADDTIVTHRTQMPIEVDDNGEWQYTLTHFSYNHTPGSFWATGGVDDLISPQNNVNEIDQALVVNRKSLGRPYVITPAELTLKRMSAKGQAILAVQYEGQTTGGQKVQVQPGVPYPDQILKERELNKETSQEAAGDPKNVLRGQPPHAGASGIMVDILRETAEQSHVPDILRFYRAWNRVNKKRLILAQTTYKETRMLKIPGKGNEILVSAFKGADLRSNTDVRFELDSGLSTTNAGRNEFLMNLAKINFFGDITQKPDVRRELLKRMGMGGFPEEDNIHRNRAEYENSMLAHNKLDKIALPNIPLTDPETGEEILDENGDSQLMFPITEDNVFRLDPHHIHVMVHDQLIFSREFQELKEQVQFACIAHRDLHMEAMKAEREEMMMEEARLANMMGGGEEGGLGGPGGPGGLPGEPGPGGPGGGMEIPPIEGIPGGGAPMVGT